MKPIDAFSRAAKLDPQDAQIQNFLGLALSEKGLRGPAETALRKAIQLDPGYANAHNNLAVDLRHPTAAPGGIGPLALPEGPRRRPPRQPGAGEDARRQASRLAAANERPRFRPRTSQCGHSQSACSARLCMR